MKVAKTSRNYTVRRGPRPFTPAAVSLLIVIALGWAGCTSDSEGTGGTTDPNDLTLLTQVLETNADIAFASYSDSIDGLNALKTAAQALVDGASEQTLAAARTAWLQANESYGFTEVYRFRGSPIDGEALGDIELQINAWPLGESLIDYVVEGNDFGDGEIGVTEHNTGVEDPIPPTNIINSTGIEITADLLSEGTSAEDERDVISGYHAIEFLLWGQDLNESDPVADAPRDTTPGQRPHTDYINGMGCTSGAGNSSDAEICQRRGQYLIVAIDKLIEDLTAVRDEWADEEGTYRADFVDPADLDEAKDRLCEILTGMGTMAEGELAGERMQIALTADSQEDEHSCFSDNTHRDIVGNAEGVFGLWNGEYPGFDSNLDGTVDNTTRAVEGYGIVDYLNEIGEDTLASDTTMALASTQMSYMALDQQVRNGMPIDNIINDAESDDAANMRDTIVRLNEEAQLFVDVALKLQLDCEVIDPEGTGCDPSDPTSPC